MESLIKTYLTLTFMSHAILKSFKDIFGMQKLSKFNVPEWNERAKEFNARYREAVSHWNIAWAPQKWSTCRTEM